MSQSADRRFMEEALRLARQPAGRTWPNPMVGSVVVKDGMIIGRGFHKGPGTPHAEVEALRDAGDKASGSTCYVNLEPCSHTGRTPPCTDALIRAGVAEVVYGMIDPNPLVSGAGLKLLETAGISTRGPVLEDDSRSINGPFIIAHTSQRPGLTLKLALSLDGMLADSHGHSAWITGAKARTRVHELRAYHQAVMVGAETFRADNPRLTPRDSGDQGRGTVTRVVICTNIPELKDKYIFDDIEENPVLFLLPLENENTLNAQLATERGARVVGLPSSANGRIDLKAALRFLYENDIYTVFCEGGADLASQLLRANLVDRLHLFRAPILLGSPGGTPGVGDLKITHLKEALRFRRLSCVDHGEDLEEILVSPTTAWTSAS